MKMNPNFFNASPVPIPAGNPADGFACRFSRRVWREAEVIPLQESSETDCWKIAQLFLRYGLGGPIPGYFKSIHALQDKPRHWLVQPLDSEDRFQIHLPDDGQAEGWECLGSKPLLAEHYYHG